MYQPEAFRADDPVVCRAVIDAHPFATLVTVADGEPFASHVPVLLEANAVVGHLARANPQWRHFSAGRALLVFNGPDAYVSPRWYVSEGQVPTWNYVVVHVSGVAELIDPEDVVRRLAARFDPAWEPDEGALASMLPGIVGFRVPLTRMTGKLKLSQNRDRADARGVRGALALGTEEERAVATWMGRWLDG